MGRERGARGAMAGARPRILITNDDCYLSRGLYLLYDAVKELGEARVYSTELPRSAVGHTISFNKPVRLVEKRYLGYRVYVTDGTPIDALHLAMVVHGFTPDLVLSGVNVGENLALQHIFYSGTIAVAVEAALHGIPAVAFSADISGYEEFEDPVFGEAVRRVARALAEHVLSRGMPEGADLLSVNFPSPGSLRGCVRVVRAARLRWRAVYERRLDTRGRPYYWLVTVPVDAEPGTDVYAVTVEGCVSITPLRVDMGGALAAGKLEDVAARVEEELRRALKGR